LNLHAVIIFLIAAGIVAPLAHRLRVSPVLVFLTVGMAIGPHGIGRFADSAPWLEYAVITDLDGVRALAELGIVFLLFMIGLELSIDRLWTMRRMVFGLGGAQVILTGIIIAVIASSFGNPVHTAAVLGASFALSSTAIVMALLSENRRLGTRVGRTGFLILLFQDLAVLPVLFLVSAFAVQGDNSTIVAFTLAIGQAFLAIVIIGGFGRLVIRPLFRFIGASASREMFLALVLLVIIGTAVATQEAGLSMALGAFLAGLLLAETEYRHEIEIDIAPFKGLLLGLFFVSVGMSLDIAQFATAPGMILLSVCGLFLIKSPILYLLARLFGEPRSVALEAALLLGQGGEFGFLVVGLASGLNLIPNDTAQFMLIVTGTTMLITPAVAHAARKVGRLLEIQEAESSDPDFGPADGLTDHVIIVGYGRVGQMLGSFLEAHESPFVALDSDMGIISRYRDTGASVFYGDASKPDLLRKFGVENATALVVTMDNAATAERVVAAAHRNWPDLKIYARAHDIHHAMQLIASGANHAVPETTEASLQLSELVLMGAGLPEQTARHIVEARR
jgi:monovalent cation:proton antiporter-2 (CPA2) family protein